MIHEHIAGVTSTTPQGVFDVRRGAAIQIHPTAAGTATVYLSCSTVDACAADLTAKNFSTGSAKWAAWSPGAVAAFTQVGVDYNVTCIALVPASGTWSFEVVK